MVYPERMKANLDSLGGLVFSQRVLLALTQKGMSREDSYAAVQRNAMEAWRGNASFLALCRADKEIGEFLADDELMALFDMGYHTKHVDTIFKRASSADASLSSRASEGPPKPKVPRTLGCMPVCFLASAISRLESVACGPMCAPRSPCRRRQGRLTSLATTSSWPGFSKSDSTTSLA